MIPSLLVLLLAAAPRADALAVRASASVSPCVSAAARAYQGASGRAVTVETSSIGSPTSARGVDVVIAVEEELTRVIESGGTDPDLDVDVAAIPWVLTGSKGGDLRSLAAGDRRVTVLGGVIGRHARRSLEALPSSRVTTELSPARLRALPAGEVALVPLSLAGEGPVTATDVPPLYARALGVRGTPRADAARAFLEFIKGEAGNAAFSACGRAEAR